MSYEVERVKFIALAMVGVLFFMGIRVGGRDNGRAVLRERCAPCHQPDEQGRLSRIAFQRKTPEGWQMTITRMQRLHGVRLTPDEKRTLIKYLSSEQGLAPAEAKPFAYLLERRDWLTETVPSERRRMLCARCHSYARIALQRRTPAEWTRLVHFHLGQFPTIEYQAGGRNIAWFEEALKEAQKLAEEFPYESETWARWKQRAHSPLKGAFGVIGYQPGRGMYTGEVTLTDLGDDEYEEILKWTFADGRQVSGRGRVILYAGYAWRSSVKLDDGTSIREVLHLSDDQRTLIGRWFLAQHEEIGGDETLVRRGETPRILAVNPPAVRRGASPATVQIWGMNFPPHIRPTDISLGGGIAIQEIVRSDERSVVVRIRVDERAAIGPRDVRIGAADARAHLVVYDHIDYIKIHPQRALARIGGTTAPKQLQQFEAIAFSNGPDGQKETADDLRIGPVSVRWTMKEFPAGLGDRDVEFVGSIDQKGLFTPADEGPNPQRRYQTNNVGDVWIEASFQRSDGRVLKARAYVIVTVPRWVKPPLR